MCCSTTPEPSLARFWELETIRINAKEKQTDFVRTHFEETVQRKEDGRYSVTLPFNMKIHQLDSNLNSAVSQLASTLKRLEGKP
uniref:Uncharacterized protein n=1 Tax=Strigamia maritima TaxID=126957 RepID=T1IL26_STRMM